MNDDKCNTKYCRGKVALIYLKKPLCQKCYEKVCDEELKKESEYLNSLVRKTWSEMHE